MGDYSVSYDSEKYIVKEIYKGILCTKKDGVDLSNLTYGNEFTCELGDNDKKTFYVLETNEDNVSLIMNANIDSNGKAITPDNIPDDKGLVAWCGDETLCKTNGAWDNKKGPIVATEKLLSRTSAWIKIDESQITLPTGIQIAKAGGDTSWNDGDNMGTALSSWLYDYLAYTTHEIPDVYGYWTSTPNSSDSNFAWYVRFNGKLYSDTNMMGVIFGIRPVITIPKSQIN